MEKILPQTETFCQTFYIDLNFSKFSIFSTSVIKFLYSSQTVNKRTEEIPSEILPAQAFIISKPYIIINRLHNWWFNVYRASKFFYHIPCSQNTFAFSENLRYKIYLVITFQTDFTVTFKVNTLLITLTKYSKTVIKLTHK